MKSKFVYLLLLCSLLLNISHDIIMASQPVTSTSTLSKTTTVDGSSIPHHELCELHKLFHFTGILSSINTVISSQVLFVQLPFVNTIFPISVKDSSFKPPIV